MDPKRRGGEGKRNVQFLPARAPAGKGRKEKKVLGSVLSEWPLVEAADQANFKSTRAAATRRQWGAVAAVSEGISERRWKQGSREGGVRLTSESHRNLLFHISFSMIFTSWLGKNI
jgi:hypothetical protein